MSVKQRVIQQAKDLTDLETLANLVSNPTAISAAAKLARHEVILTQEQEAKFNAAKAFIGSADMKAAELKSREDALTAAKAEHESDVSEFEKATKAFNESVNAINADYAEKSKQHAEEWQKLAEAQKQTDLRNQVADAAMRRREALVQKREEDCKRREDAQEAEDRRLAQNRATLDRKAKLLSEAIGS